MEALNANGIKTDLPEVQTMIGKSYKEMMEYYTRREGRVLNIPADFEQQVEERYFMLADRLQPMSGVIPLLERLNEMKVPLAVASSGGYRKIRFSLEKTGLAKYFNTVCSAVDVSKGKPEPDLFLYAAAKLGYQPADCLVVEDSLYGVKAAKRAGMIAVAYPSSFSRDRLLEAGADCVIPAFDDFFAELAKLQLTLADLG